MSHKASIRWTAEGDFERGKYSRAHRWEFDGGARVPASASPDVVPVPLSDPAGVDPEEAFVASVSSCHMLWFLDFARRAGFNVAAYADDAVGRLEKDEQGRPWVSRVDLNIKVTWTGDGPAAAEHEALHHKAHDACFIANSVRSEIVTNILEG